MTFPSWSCTTQLSRHRIQFGCRNRRYASTSFIALWTLSDPRGHCPSQFKQITIVRLATIATKQTQESSQLTRIFLRAKCRPEAVSWAVFVPLSRQPKLAHTHLTFTKKKRYFTEVDIAEASLAEELYDLERAAIELDVRRRLAQT
jgi:hypothetical protein